MITEVIDNNALMEIIESATHDGYEYDDPVGDDEWYGWEVYVEVPNISEEVSEQVKKEIMQFYADLYTEACDYKVRFNDTIEYDSQDGTLHISFALQGEGR